MAGSFLGWLVVSRPLKKKTRSNKDLFISLELTTLSTAWRQTLQGQTNEQKGWLFSGLVSGFKAFEKKNKE